MRVAVKDACLLIDLANGGLLEAWFQLGIETCTTDLVLRQVKADNQWQAVKAFVDASLLLVHSLSGNELLKIHTITLTSQSVLKTGQLFIWPSN